MSQDAGDELARHLFGVNWVVVEGGDYRKDYRSCFGGEGHVAEMDAVEGGFADAEDEWAAFLERDVCGAGYECVGEAVGDGGERAHGAWENDHSGGWMAAAGDGCAYVFVGVLDGFLWLGAEEFFREAVAAGDIEFFGEDAEGVFTGDEMDAGDAVVGFEGTEHGAGEDGA